MIEALLKYQEKDAELRKIEMEFAASEDRKKGQAAKKFIDGYGENVEKLDLKAQELVSAYEIATKKQLELKEQQEELNNALDGANNENEIAFLLKKCDELIASIKAFGQEAVKIANEIQNVLKEFATLKAKYGIAKTQYAESLEKYSQLKASKKDEKEAINAELAKLKKAVDKDLMERYQKKRNEKIFPIIVEVNEENCGYCSMAFSMSDLSKLKNGEILECEHCRRLIYKA